MMLSDWLVVIPARLQSLRLPRKMLADLHGKPLVVRVYENLKPLQTAGATIVVATDAEEVRQACEAYQVPAQLTRPEHVSGTDRCAEIASQHPHGFIMNVQGDEPFIDTKDLLNLANTFKSQHNIPMATLRYLCHDQKKLLDPNVVKVVTGRDNHALYFSRSPIPFVRDLKSSEGVSFYQHLGIYCYRREALQSFCSLTAGALEQVEKLEQLRALECGMKILLVDARSPSHGIDTPEDLAKARELFCQR